MLFYITLKHKITSLLFFFLNQILYLSFSKEFTTPIRFGDTRFPDHQTNPPTLSPFKSSVPFFPALGFAGKDPKSDKH